MSSLLDWESLVLMATVTGCGNHPRLTVITQDGMAVLASTMASLAISFVILVAELTTLAINGAKTAFFIGNENSDRLITFAKDDKIKFRRYKLHLKSCAQVPLDFKKNMR